MTIHDNGVHGIKFELIEYKDRLGRIKPCYSLTKTVTLYIATKFNDEVRAKQFSIALKDAGVTRNSVQQMLKNWRIQGLVEQMDDGKTVSSRFHSFLQFYIFFLQIACLFGKNMYLCKIITVIIIMAIIILSYEVL